jgi:glucose-6-phosphate 1-dehydrogenase
MAESFGVKGRGKFYEETGVIATSSRTICFRL